MFDSIELTKPHEGPTLIVSTDALLFPKTAPGKVRSMILTISQQHTDTPVTLTTDTPERFQLASDSRPAFGPSLTIVPSPTGTYVHIRYTPQRFGKHIAQLTIEAPYDTRTITLTGRSGGILAPGGRVSATVPRRIEPPATAAPARRPVGVVVALLLAGGLAYAGYTYRCQLVPSLCQAAREPAPSATDSDASAIDPVAVEPTPVKVNAAPLGGRAKDRQREPGPAAADEKPANAARTDTDRNPRSNVPVRPDDRAERSTPTGQPNPSRPGNPINGQPRRQTTSPSATEESDLERELNRPPDRQ